MKENNMLVNWKLESDVNDYVKKQFENLGFEKIAGLLMKNLL
ncbi:N-6 DNA methylase [Streptococcus pneumoniae]|nr:hypothetical protein SPAR69_0820 [Streptococcus pneumoniae GA41317]EHZ72449.1 DNA topoisomerase IV subunit A [Streptococcus pneumoniae GA49194]EHZ91674.1 DNA topoisomerase IV subunit A [Streptococcus pneumoniae EU-NP03]CTO44423.1 hypothetical protein ERS070076_00497 [Streptococcus pneumoniae]CTO58186.1 hypothetical protein ERS070148_00472 [Streptococcus pneumoniae]